MKHLKLAALLLGIAAIVAVAVVTTLHASS